MPIKFAARRRLLSRRRCRAAHPALAGGGAPFTMVAVIAAFAWGMWQVWLICAVGLLPLYLLMSAALLRAPACGETAPASR
jgi:hypothetical protein